MTEPLLILGASARAAAWSARRAGFEPLAVDVFGDEDLRAVARSLVARRYPDDLERLADDFPQAAWIFTGGIENQAELVDRIASRRRLWGNVGPVLNQVRDHLRVARVCREAGFSVPSIVHDADLVPQDGSWLRKAHRGSGGCHVSRWQGTRHASNDSNEWYYQERVDGLPCSAIFVGAARQAWLAGITLQRIGLACGGSHEFQYCGSIAPWPVPADVRRRVGDLGNVLADAFGLVGLFGVDFVLRGDEIMPLEVNPRYTASIEVLERPLGWTSLRDHRAACLEQRLPTLPAPVDTSIAAGKAILFVRRKIFVPHDLAARYVARNHDPCWPALADIPHGGALIRSGQPLATVLVTASDARQVELQLGAALAALEGTVYGQRPVGDDAA